jgi:catechol 2,3-dioxygenase-like lactoylglutathione lyase family enzyme
MDRPRPRYGDRGGELIVVLDCSDLDRSASFWTAVLGYTDAGGGQTYRTLVPVEAFGIEILLQRVPEAKAAKNRMHLDLRTPDLESEVGRVRSLGGRQLTEEPQSEWGWTWHVLADPDGNELCILQPPSDYWTDQEQ